MRIGPVILDLLGTELTDIERELLQHPSVGGVILFSRNYSSPQQLISLCQSIRQSRTTPLLITVDQEGGRVQRFKEGFTRLPSMGQIGKIYDSSPTAALQLSEVSGWIMAMEVLGCGIDLSFAPVLDLDINISPVIGDRAFHRDPAIVVKLATAWIKGMREAGMAATGKHFPGHGSVNLDSHVAIPIDQRSLNKISALDLQPFLQLSQAGLPAMMAAHIIFPKIDDKPVGFSSRWLQTILREQCHFSGVIISDDLNMQGASIMGDYPQRAVAALDAGCNLILICNNRQAAIRIVDELPQQYFLSEGMFQQLEGKRSVSLTVLSDLPLWQKRRALFTKLLCLLTV